MARKGLRIAGLSTDGLVASIKLESGFIRELVQEIAVRDDCTIYHLLDLAETPVITVFLGEPSKVYATLWQENNVIETKLKSLPLKKQIAAAKYVMEKYDRDDAREALKTFILCIKAPENSVCANLLSIAEDEEFSVEQHAAFFEALELLAKKEGLLK